MKKIAKRLISLACVAALATTCVVGASAASYNGTVSSFSWTARCESLGVYDSFRVSTSGGWSTQVYGGSRGVKANYMDAGGYSRTDAWKYATGNSTIVTYDCVHTPVQNSRSSNHTVSVNGSSDSMTLRI